MHLYSIAFLSAVAFLGLAVAKNKGNAAPWDQPEKPPKIFCDRYNDRFTAVKNEVKINRPGIDGCSFPLNGYANRGQDYTEAALTSELSVCHFSKANKATNFTWTFTFDKTEVSVRTSENCYLTWQAPYEGDFEVTVAIYKSDSKRSETTKSFVVKDIWIVTLGDSWASGQGEPDVRANGVQQSIWQDIYCYRSTHSFAHMLVEKLMHEYPDHSIQFSFLACAGKYLRNETRNDILQLDTTDGQLAEVNSMQTLAVANIKYYYPDTTFAPVPNLIITTAGSNDVYYWNDFSINYKDGTWTLDEIRTIEAERLVTLGEDYNTFASALTTMGVPSERNWILPYYSFLPNEDGNSELGCAGSYWIDANATTLEAMEEIFIYDELNVVIEDAATAHGWTFVQDTLPLTEINGICADDQHRLFVTAAESWEWQGNYRGWIHLLRAGHQKYADFLWPQVKTFIADQLN